MMVTRGYRATLGRGLVVAGILASMASASDAAVATRRLEANIEHVEQGGAVARFDLSDVPRDATMYRARLLCDADPLDPADPQALVSVAIYPLIHPYVENKPPQYDRQPLSLVGPGYRSFDVTDLVRGWIAGRPNGLYVKTFPGWRPDKTFLDVMYEGDPGEVPPLATGLKAFHRAGQTFIIWQEVDSLVRSEKITWGEIKRLQSEADDACCYRLYTHTRPIDAKSIAEAKLLAEIGPLSAYNTSGRNLEYLIGQAMLQPDQIGELAQDYNGYMYTWGMDHPRMDRYPVERFVVEPGRGPLPVGTGLYVHSSTSPGRRYYAVVACCRGVENTVSFTSGNSLSSPVEETVGPGEPVPQGPGLWGPYFDYPGRRQVYVQWCAPPLAPRPNMAFNWSVLVPPGLKRDEKAPVELYFHAGNFSYAKPRKKHIRDSIQIAPHDYPFSGWYGFNDAWGTLRGWREGIVRNHTQQRIIAFLNWAQGGLPLDPERIILCGADGAAVLAMDYRETFAYALIYGFEGKGDRYGRILDPDQAARFAQAWGPQSPEIQDEHGRPNWEWAMPDGLALQRPEVSMPLLVCRGGSFGGVRGYGKAFGPYYTNLQQAHQPLIAGFGWDTQLITPDYYTGLWQRRRHFDNVPTLDVTRTTPIPALANASTSREKLQYGNVNGMHWWTDVVDQPDRFQITLGGPGTVDLTPRRVQRFKVRPGERLRWQTTPLPDPRKPKDQGLELQSGMVTADSGGLVTIRGLNVPRGGVTVTILRAE